MSAAFAFLEILEMVWEPCESTAERGGSSRAVSRTLAPSSGPQGW